MADPAAVVGPRRGTLHALLVEMRPRSWVKNLACLAGLIFSGQLFSGSAQALAAAGVLAFCLSASAVYIFNDLLDLEHDRRNPRTARRPLAAGEIAPATAALFGAVCAAAGLSLAWWVAPRCAAVAAMYGVMNLAYSWRLRQAVIADVMTIALGFVLRVLFGIYAVGAPATPWVFLCIFFLALFLGFAKRKAELGSSNSGAAIRPVLEKYTPGYLDVLLAMCAAMTIICYAVFTVTSHKNPSLVVTVAPVVYCVLRYLQNVMVGGLGETPEEILLRDRHMWFGILVWLGLCIVVIYNDVHWLAESP